MTKNLDVFCEIPCLTEVSKHLAGLNLQKKWFKSADKRIIGQYLQKFIYYNSEQFKFLGVEPKLIGTDQSSGIVFNTSHFIGAVPLRSPDTGKQIGDFIVTPRFANANRYQDYIEILNILGNSINPEIIDSLPLASGRNFRPPLYLEAVKFISLLENLLRTDWRKFDCIEKITNDASSQINWKKYINDAYKVENRLKFPSRKNILSSIHSEYSNIRYVFDFCKFELLSGATPTRVKFALRNKLDFIEEKLYLHRPKITDQLKIHFSDSSTVKVCKEQANKILSFNLVDSTAWRVDFSDVFEKFVQFIFRELANEIGGKVHANFQFNSKTQLRYSWELQNLEPDIIFQKGELLVIAEAKYKSNLYNKFNQSEVIKERHRHDLHQIISYASFSKTDLKHGFLCYPSDKVEIKRIKYANGLNNAAIWIYVLGIPLNKTIISEAKNLIRSVIYGKV